MGIIAVAGGTGSVGKTIVEALVAHGKHNIVVLTRSTGTPLNGTSLLQVNYDDIEATAKALEAENIDTVISAIGMMGDESSVTQIKLIEAAAKAASTRRFVISGYDLCWKEEHIPWIPIAKWMFDAISALEKTDLEYTRVVNGFFLDYYGMPHYKSHMKPWTNAINVEEKWAALPGDGSATCHYITTQDMARFVALLMDLEKWSKISSIAGEALSFNELQRLGEEARGEKFSVTYNKIEDLENGKASFPSVVDAGLGDIAATEQLLALFQYLATIGDVLVPTDDTLNSRFPDVKLTTAAEVMNTSWKGK